MDYPPDAKIPIYNDKTYVKVLRLPKNVKLNFKNSELFSDVKKASESLIDMKTPKNQNENNGNIPQINSNNIPNNLFNSSNSNNSNNSNSSDNKKTSSPEKSFDKQKSKSNVNIINVDSSTGFGIENIDFEKISKKLQDNEGAKTNFSTPLIEVFPTSKEEGKNKSASNQFNNVNYNKNSGNDNFSNPCKNILI